MDEQAEMLAEGAFAQFAGELRNRGLWPIPCGGEDGKEAQPKGYTKCRSPYSEETIAKFIQQWPGANLGILTGKSALVVVDIDDPSPEFLRKMLERFGDTPLIVRTGSGNVHFYYKARGGEKALNLRSTEEIPVEIKADKVIVIVPPSINPETGGVYSFERGSWDDLGRLPYFDCSSLNASKRREKTAATKERNPVGMRNNALFDHLRKVVTKYCAKEELQALADRYNATMQEVPEEQSKVDATVEQVWRYHVEGRNFAHKPGCAIPHELNDILARYTTGGDALILYNKLRQMHGATGEPFALATKNMEAGDVLQGWREKRYRNAKRVLVEIGLLKLITKGNRKRNGRVQADLFEFVDRSMSRSTPAAD